MVLFGGHIQRLPCSPTKTLFIEGLQAVFGNLLVTKMSINFKADLGGKGYEDFIGGCLRDTKSWFVAFSKASASTIPPLHR